MPNRAPSLPAPRPAGRPLQERGAGRTDAAESGRLGFVANPVIRKRLRQVALLAAILISGGLMLFPREPLLLVVLLACFTLKNPLEMFRAEFAVIWFLLLAVAAVVLIGGESFQVMPMVTRYANFAAGLALLMVYVDERRSTLAGDLYWILKLMAFQAILTPVMVILFSRYFTTFELSDTTYQTLLYVFTYHEFVDFGLLFKRPDGFFYEPGVFQIYLNIFLFICLFVRRQRPFDIGLAALAVIATQSTTGAVILVLQFAAAYFLWLKTANRSQKLGIFVFVPIMLLPLAGYMTYNVTEKFYGAMSGSAEAREYDLYTGLRVTMEKPFTGIGFDYEKYFDVAGRVGYREADLSRENITERGNTNGLVVLLFSVGIPLALVFFYGMLRQRLFRPRLLFGTLIMLSLVSESLSLSPVMLMVTFSGLLIAPTRLRNALPSRGQGSPSLQRA